MIVQHTDAEKPILTAGVVRLAQSGVLHEATHIVLRDQWFADEGLAALIDGIDPSKLVSLVITGSGIGSEGADRLARATQLSGLRELNVAFCYFPADAVRVLVTAPHWTALERLDLSQNGVDASIATALAASAFASTLRDLALNDCNDLDDAFVERLCEAGAFPKLETLGLGWAPITDRGARALADAPSLPALQSLLLEGTKIGVDGIACLRARGLASLGIDPPWAEDEPPPQYESDPPQGEPF